MVLTRKRIVLFLPEPKVSKVVNEKAYRLSFCEDPFLCTIISSDSNDSVDTCRHKIRMLFQPTYVRFPLWYSKRDFSTDPRSFIGSMLPFTSLSKLAHNSRTYRLASWNTSSVSTYLLEKRQLLWRYSTGSRRNWKGRIRGCPTGSRTRLPPLSKLAHNSRTYRLANASSVSTYLLGHR